MDTKLHRPTTVDERRGVRLRNVLVAAVLALTLLGVTEVPPARGESSVRVEGVVNEVRFTNGDIRNPIKGEELYLSLSEPLGGASTLKLVLGRSVKVTPAHLAAGEDLDHVLASRRVIASGSLSQPSRGGLPVFTADHIQVKDDASVGTGFDISGGPTRIVPLLTVLCRFNDQLDNQGPQSYFEGLLGPNGLAADYWKEATYDQVSFASSKVVPESGSWYVLPSKMSEYLIVGEDKTDMDLVKLYDDCTKLAAQDVNLDNFGIVNLMFNTQLVNYSFGGGWGGRRVTWIPGNHWKDAWIVLHELGHALGGLHSPFQAEYDNAWDLESGANLATQPNPIYGNVPQHPNVWNKDRSGWIGPERKVAVPTQGTTTFTLVSASNPVSPGPIMATIKPDGFHSYILEFRTLEGYDAGLPFGGESGAVIIHEVFDDPDPKGKGPRAVLLGADGGVGARWLEGDVLKRWELNTPYVPNVYDIDGFLIRVDEISAHTAKVTVTRLPYSLVEKGVRSTTAYAVTWDDITDVETDFMLQYWPVGHPEQAETTLRPANSTSYIRAGLQPGQEFVHRIRACNAIGCGPWSPEFVYGTKDFGIQTK